MNLDFLKFCPLIFASLFFGSAFSMEYGSEVLLIGRPEHGGVDIKQAAQNFPQITSSRIWYLDPRSQGDFSIREFFPCPMPSDKPQHYDIVCVEQGMLNEVALADTRATPLPTTSSAVLPSEPAQFMDAEEQFLAEKMVERQKVWEHWTQLREERKNLNLSIIQKALQSELLEETMEWGNPYYRIPGLSKMTFSDVTIVDHVFGFKERLLVERTSAFAPVALFERELQRLDRDIDLSFQEMSALDKLIDPLQKLKEKEQKKLLAVDSSMPSSSMAERDPTIACRRIQSLVQEAWHLVRPNGVMIVFSRNGQIAETDLANGISIDYLMTNLSGAPKIDEYSFDSQSYDGERYISNPALPAQADTFGWSGPRAAGSYFVIKKPE